jgi:hypothetical protein
VGHADEAGSWDNLHERFEVKRINHQEVYSFEGACTNWAEEYFSRFRRAEVGIHHHVARADLLRNAREWSWRDNRRVPNGDQVSRIAAPCNDAEPKDRRAVNRHTRRGHRPLPQRYHDAGIEPPMTTKAELNRYFEMIDRRVPMRVSRFIRWLRKPSSFAVRLLVALLLILGGFFSFLPVLGLWMLPLGLLFIAQDVPILQKPLVRALAWVEANWERLKVKWRSR